MMTYLFMLTVLTGCQCIQALEPPDWESGWFLMESQSATESEKIIQHGLGELPIKVKILIKPTQGPSIDLVFEASTSQRQDDDERDGALYCGLLYIYDDSNVYLYAPHKYNNASTGRIFCTGEGSWTDGNPEHHQTENKALVNVLAWREDSFPTPEFSVGWTAISVTAPDDFHQIAHGLGEDINFVHVQTRCMHGSSHVYGEGTGDDGLLSTQHMYHAAGVLVGYNAGYIRLWAPVSDLLSVTGILAVMDGWGTGDTFFTCPAGEFRLFAWTSLGYLVYQYKFYPGDSTSFRLNPRLWQIETDYLTIQVFNLDEESPNYGLAFQPDGQIQITDSGAILGGISYGYNAAFIRIYTPLDPARGVLHVGSKWGPTETTYNVQVQNVGIAIRIWATVSNPGANAVTRSVTFKIPDNAYLTPCMYDSMVFCAAACAEQPTCVEFPHCANDGTTCQLENENYVNQAVTTGTYTSGEAVQLQKFKYNYN